MNPICNFLKSQLISPRVSKTTPQPSSSNKLKFTENWCLCTLMSTCLASPLVLITTPLAIFTLTSLEMSTVNSKALAKLQSRKLWVLHVLRSTTALWFLMFETTLMVFGEGLPSSAFKVISSTTSSTFISSSHFSESIIWSLVFNSFLNFLHNIELHALTLMPWTPFIITMVA